MMGRRGSLDHGLPSALPVFVAVLGAGEEILLFLFTVGFVFHLFMSLKCDLLFWIHFPAIQAQRGLFLL